LMSSRFASSSMRAAPLRPPLLPFTKHSRGFPRDDGDCTRRLGRPGRARLVPLHALLVRRPGARGRVRARDVPRPRARRGKRRGRPSSSPGRSLRRSSESRSAPARARHPSRRRRRGGGGERRHRERGHRAHHARVSE
jgi:hypothetical protein